MCRLLLVLGSSCFHKKTRTGQFLLIRSYTNELNDSYIANLMLCNSIVAQIILFVNTIYAILAILTKLFNGSKLCALGSVFAFALDWVELTLAEAEGFWRNF